MKSKILFLAVLALLLSKPTHCFSQSDTRILKKPDCCPGENSDEYYQAFYPVDDCSVFALINGLSEIVEPFVKILVEVSSIVVEDKDENPIEMYSSSKTTVRSKIGDRLEIESATTYESIFDSDDNDAYSFSVFLSMTFIADNDHTFKLHSETIELNSEITDLNPFKDDTQTSTKMNYWIRKNNKVIFFNYSINDVVSSANNNEIAVNQLFGQLTEYLNNLGCKVEMQTLEKTRSRKTEIVNHVCLCAEIAKFKENVKLIE
jgi:hypothetical protein